MDAVISILASVFFEVQSSEKDDLVGIFVVLTVVDVH